MAQDPVERQLGRPVPEVVQHDVRVGGRGAEGGRDLLLGPGERHRTAGPQPGEVLECPRVTAGRHHLARPLVEGQADGGPPRVPGGTEDEDRLPGAQPGPLAQGDPGGGGRVHDGGDHDRIQPFRYGHEGGGGCGDPLGHGPVRRLQPRDVDEFALRGAAHSVEAGDQRQRVAARVVAARGERAHQGVQRGRQHLHDHLAVRGDGLGYGLVPGRLPQSVDHGCVHEPAPKRVIKAASGHSEL